MKTTFDRQKILQRVKDGVFFAIQKSAFELQANVQKSLNQGASNFGGAPSSPGSPPHNRTGALMRSIQAIDLTVDPIRPSYRVGTNLEYARIQEYGGPIRPKPGHKYLAIPVGDEGRRAARAANGDLRKLRLQVQRTKSGKLLLVQTIGPGEKAFKGGTKSRYGETRILFVLKKFVILPARPYMRPAYNAAQPMIRENIAKATMKALGVKVA